MLMHFPLCSQRGLSPSVHSSMSSLQSSPVNPGVHLHCRVPRLFGMHIDPFLQGCFMQGSSCSHLRPVRENYTNREGHIRLFPNPSVNCVAYQKIPLGMYICSVGVEGRGTTRRCNKGCLGKWGFRRYNFGHPKARSRYTGSPRG